MILNLETETSVLLGAFHELFMKIQVLFPLRLMNEVLLEAAEEQGKMSQETTFSPGDHLNTSGFRVTVSLLHTYITELKIENRASEEGNQTIIRSFSENDGADERLQEDDQRRDKDWNSKR
jgi:hypothetical protein